MGCGRRMEFFGGEGEYKDAPQEADECALSPRGFAERKWDEPEHGDNLARTLPVQLKHARTSPRPSAEIQTRMTQDAHM